MASDDTCDRLTELFAQIARCRSLARDKGRESEVEILSGRKDKIKKILDNKLYNALGEWNLKSSQLITKLQTAQNEVEKVIAGVDEQTRFAQEVVKLAGIIDDIAETLG